MKVTIERETLELALAYFEAPPAKLWPAGTLHGISASLRAALAAEPATSADYARGYAEGFNDACKPKPAEPVAWRVRRLDSPKYWIIFMHKPVDAIADPEREVQPLYAAPPAPAAEPEGYALVPIEPTQAMMYAMQSSGSMPANYRAMIAAAGDKP